MAITPLAINNPTMGFRLDPGEPGMLRRGRASEATLLVTSQEHRNLVRLKSEAMREGRVIIHAGIQFGRAFQGPFLTTTNGLTTVISRAARPSVFESEAERAVAGQAQQPVEPLGAGLEIPQDEQAPVPAAAPGGERILAEEENRLRAELRRLESPGFGEPAGPLTFEGEAPQRAGDDPLRPLEDAATRRAGRQREGQTSEVEGELRRLQFARMMRKLAGSLAASA